ncbi:16S rRNA (cytosine(1402)-N(4))-methyltransferase [Candidatus Nomurabacteria bacterium RIFCSPLOWO2_02_FULL_42_17]|uniref:Ribosomal RNA small subunit methyltransferase H n=2 Tax=Candidatus Nomuraibacteriota TaxID=1752729 RepID=A0A1F6WK44_9BACT|nr:MAG: Ribosomal RNA small subunit methyltransferase H [Parcubacteria group bacterium GW2011_GWA2_42_18]OGI82250.1 MAG: 16S rRNA (cytosine(1402)-N(4))-methyltransferase [Candidatus Nomurabacteria bacterium RIFCSPHIGHO2_02_FULL_42_24]OGI96033.1 MAG: 16S rRNA (cytosine(1402)-N(4))-methyltransferase [Candidatus Nomurabacteria bacterium RIFCSPLOWO2_02_FULL_42_17]
MGEHKPVLLKETIEGLAIEAGDVVVDCTVGLGGHSVEICRQFGNKIVLIGLDADEYAVKQAGAKLQNCNAAVFTANFRDLKKVLDELKVKKINRVIFDLGLSSWQIEGSGRGFSFRRDEPLLMTFSSQNQGLTAHDAVNDWKEENLEIVIRGFGEERYARSIAKKIVEARKIRPIETTGQLVEIIRFAVPNAYRYGRVHFATKTFQALRIAINEELKSLELGLEQAFEKLASRGRIAVISFHSLEDRIVKKFFAGLARGKKAWLINKKPVMASEAELVLNPRSRSAKLRILEKI